MEKIKSEVNLEINHGKYEFKFNYSYLSLDDLRNQMLNDPFLDDTVPNKTEFVDEFINRLNLNKND
jgi:hypothetical protein